MIGAGAREVVRSAVRVAYRVAFAIGVAAFGASLALGLAQAFRSRGRPPPLLVDPLVVAQREFAGRDPERWIAEARSLTEIQPRNLGAFLALARALSEAHRLDPAIRAYETALSLGPVPPVAHAQLARLYYRRGDLDAAREQVRLAQQRGVSLSGEFLRALGLDAAPAGEG
jgi:cytochrome c-type biogenesis protein CcmH/NrfG